MKSAPNTLLKSSCASWASFSWCATNSSHSRDFLLARLNPPAVLSNARDRKSTRLNSSHSQISYAVFCLKKKIEHQSQRTGPVSGRPPFHLLGARSYDERRRSSLIKLHHCERPGASLRHPTLRAGLRRPS